MLKNNTEILTFDQLGGLHFQGSVQGILPIGPNGVSAFDTLAPSPLSKPDVAGGMISYDYTLNHQGLTSNVSCSYAPTHPFHFTSLSPTGAPVLAAAYNVSCTDQGKTDALTGLFYLFSAWSNYTLACWACQDEIPTASYTVYLSGFGLPSGYPNTVGNITCVINPIQTAIYSVMYRSTEDVFSTTEANAPSRITFSTLINHALVGLATLVSESQNYGSNLFAETIINLGHKEFGLPADLPPPQYLRLYEQMIQGIIEYEVCLVNYFIPFLSLIVCHLTDDIPSVDLFDTFRCPFLLQTHGDWATAIRGIRLVHDEVQHRLFDSNNDH